MIAQTYIPLLELKTSDQAEEWIAKRVAAIRAADTEKADKRTDEEIAGLERSNAVVWFAQFNHLQHPRIRALFYPPAPEPTAAEVHPSPGGEGRDEGEPQTDSAAASASQPETN